MRRYGAFEIKNKIGKIYEETVGPEELEDVREDRFGRVFTRAPKACWTKHRSDTVARW